MNKKAVTVTAQTPTAIAYGDATPAIGYTTSPSTVAGDWTTQPTCSVYATTDTTYATPLTGTLAAGSYATQCSGGTSTNYNPTTYTPGTLDVNLLPARTTVTGIWSLAGKPVYKVTTSTTAIWTSRALAAEVCDTAGASCTTDAMGVVHTPDGDFYYSPDGIHYTFFPSP